MPTGIALLWLQWEIATDILSKMDTSTDPCVDFHRFACGNYGSGRHLLNDTAVFWPMLEITLKNVQNIRELLEDPLTRNDTQSTRLAKTYYKSCMNESAMEQLELSPLKKLLKRYGGWPVLERGGWNESSYDWISMNAHLTRDLGASRIMQLSAGADYKNSIKQMLHIDQPTLGLGKRDYYVDKNQSQVLLAYLRYMLLTAVQLGATKSEALEELVPVLKLEIALAEISVRDEERRDLSMLYKPVTIKQLKEQHPLVNFTTWFATVAELGWEFDDTDVVNLDGYVFLERLPRVLANFSERTLANYQIWMLVADYVINLAPSQREHYRQFRHALTGASIIQPRALQCVTESVETMQWPVGAMYVEKYFSTDDKRQVERMLYNIRDAMKGLIEDSVWMENSTKAAALIKLANMHQLIGYPEDHIDDEEWIMNDYLNATLREDTYFDNVVSLQLSLQDRIVREFDFPINLTEWAEAPATTNAFYDPQKNRIVFPAGILRYPLYNLAAPMYVNYGRIGYAMGHELTHGFDDEGRQFDSEGNFAQWWTNETLSEFKKRAKCLIEQYGSIVEPTSNQTLNGENTIGENIADNGGLRLAYKAYQLHMANTNRTDQYLSRLRNYTTDQLFFLSFAQYWCEIIRPEALKFLITIDNHAPAKYRINVPLQNDGNFARAFNCPVGSPLNPLRKCRVW